MRAVVMCCRLVVLCTIAICVCWCLVGVSVPVLAAERDTPNQNLFFLDLQADANALRSQPLHGFPDNHLGEIPAGEQTFAGRKLVVGERYLKLGSPVEPRNPRLIEGIAVNQKLRKVSFLHGTGFGAYGNPGDTLFVADGTGIGEYRINYADGTTEKIPIVYGEDVRDWWSWTRDFRVKRGEVAWEGENPFSRKQRQKIRLYLATWKNPKPEMLILSIDYASTGTSAAAPFCIAITGEGERVE